MLFFKESYRTGSLKRVSSSQDMRNPLTVCVNLRITKTDLFQYRILDLHSIDQTDQCRLPQVEISYICLHLKGAKHEKIQWNQDAQIEMENKELQQLVNDMIDAYDARQAYLMKQDDGFIQALLGRHQTGNADAARTDNTGQI